MQTFTTCLHPNEWKSFVAGEFPDHRVAEVEQHLSLCDTCRAALENTAGDRSWWSDVELALGGDSTQWLDSSARAHADSENAGELRATEIQRLIDLLGPTDNPNMMGRIGSYEVVGILGQGGMGAVFKAFDAALNRYVAIKVLLPHLASSGAARARFRREGQAAAAVIDDHVLPIYVVDEWQGTPYLVMQYTRGMSLQKRLHQQGPLELREILRVGLHAARGLAAAHAQGLVHRDVKPSNILLDSTVERSMLTDFGLARAADDASLTRSGTLAGTPQYMSPEQARAEAVDCRSDLFSLGSVLYAMCTGHAPFRADSSYAVLRLITDKEPRPIREINPDIPEWLCSIVGKLLSKQADDRFDSAEEVAELLEACLGHVQQPMTTPIPAPVAKLVKSFGYTGNSSTVESLDGFRHTLRSIFNGRPPIAKYLAAAAAGFSLIFAGALIVLELNKGTLTINSPSPDVPIRISQGDQVVDRITVRQGENATRIKAGQNVIEIDGDHGDFSIEDNKVTLAARGKETVVITQIEHAESVPAMREIEGKWAPVLRQQASERTRGDMASDSSQPASTVQVVFRGPKGLVVNMRKEQEAGFVDPPIENHGPCPSRWNIAITPNHYRRLRLTGIPGHDEVVVLPTILFNPANSDTKSLLAHNAISIEFTTEDFEQVFKGNEVRKVIYLPNPEFANRAINSVETLVSTRLDPGVNLVQEAQRLGSILAIVEIEDYVKRRTETCEGMPLAEAVRNLNADLSRRTHHIPEQPPLTVDEVIAWARWNLSLMRDDRYENYRAPYQRIVDHRVMPDEGCFMGDIARYTENDLSVLTFQINMTHQLPLFVVEGDVQYYVRRTFVSSEWKSETKPLLTEGTALSEAIAEFNESCKMEDPSQRLLTEEEVIASLRNQLFKNWIDRPKNMTKELVATMQSITEGRVLPESAEFVLNTEFEPGDGIKYRIWRPSIRITIGDESVARTFPLRTHFLSSK